MDCIFATKPPLFTPQCEVEANWNWFCLSTQTHSFHTERPGALKHKSGHFSTRTLFSYLYPSHRLILTKISSIALLWSYLHLVCLGAAFQRTPKRPVDSKYPENPSKPCLLTGLMLFRLLFFYLLSYCSCFAQMLLSEIPVKLIWWWL